MKQYILAAAVAVLVALPGTSQAFELVNTTAYDFGFAQLFMLEFEFGYLNAETVMPVVTAQTDVALKYSADGEALATGESGAIFLSDAQVDQNGYYRVAVGERETFTLLAIYQNETVSADTVTMTSFNHLIIKNDKLLEMNPTSEQLASYTASLE